MPRSSAGSVTSDDFFDAHGGLDQLKSATAVRMDLHHGGALWKIKRRSWPEITSRAIASPADQTVEQIFRNAPGRSSLSESEHVALYCKSGELDQNIFKPRSWFSGHTLDTPWWDLQSVYFSGCMVWNTVCLPFALAAPGVLFQEMPGHARDGTWLSRLRVTFPENMAMLARVQILNLDLDGSLRHVELDLEMVGDTPCVLAVEDYRSVDGLRVPVACSISLRERGNAVPILSATYSNLEVEKASRGVAASGLSARRPKSAIELPVAI